MPLSIAGLTACGGGGNFSPRPLPVEPPDPVDPPDPTPPEPDGNGSVVDPPDLPPRLCESGAAGVDDPSRCIRGRFAVPGIDQIPLEHVRVTNEEMRKMFVIFDFGGGHLHRVGRTACESYITGGECRDAAQRVGKTRRADGTVVEDGTGSVPFTQLLDESDHIWYISEGRTPYVQIPWMEEEMNRMGTVKLVVRPVAGTRAFPAIGDRDLPYLTVHSAGNDGHNRSWFHDLHTPEEQRGVRKAIAANKLIFVAGWDRDADGNYTRHHESSSCRDVDDGCVWAQYYFPGIGGGTSHSAPQFASALASVLAVFPDTSPEDLAAFGKSCAKKTGEGIEALLAESGGLGVADFHCMGGVISALTDLPNR